MLSEMRLDQRALKRRCAPLPGGSGGGEFGRRNGFVQPCDLAGGPLTKAPGEAGFGSTLVCDDHPQDRRPDRL